MTRFLCSTVLLATLTVANPLRQLEVERTQCVACSPAGIKATAPPSIGPGLIGFYGDLISSVQNIHWKRSKSGNPKADDSPICCAQNTQCVLMNGLGIPFCYDKFTTNFFLPDGSFGNLYNGSYQARDGQKANLISGQITGSEKNIYAASPNAKPNTATMHIPSVYTASGVGLAIPATSVGNGIGVAVSATGPTTISAVTIEPTTIAATTISGSIVPAYTITGTTIPARTIAASSVVVLESGTVVPTGVRASAAAASTGKPAAGPQGNSASTNLASMGVALVAVLAFCAIAL